MISMIDNRNKLTDKDLMTPFIQSIISNQAQQKRIPIKDVIELSNSVIPEPPAQAVHVP
jgi:hypothetical protein